MDVLLGDSQQRALSSVVLRCLDKRDQLYLDWRTVLEQSGTYQGTWVDEQDLHDKALEAYALILRRIAGFEIGGALSSISDRVGARRAEQGVSLEEVRAAANFNFKVVWNALLSEATAQERDVLLEQVPDVWAAVDEHTQRISWAYTRRRDELDRLSGDRRREWFSRLLKCDGERPEVVERAGDVLEFDVAGRFRVVVAPRVHAAELRAVREALVLLRWAVHHQEIEVGDLLVVQTPQASDERLLKTLEGLRCAVAPPAFGLDEVPRATRIAGDIISVLPPERNEPAFLEDAWFTVAAS